MRLWRWLSPTRLPVLIGAAILFVPWFFFTWNITVAQVVPKLRFRTDQTLLGAFRQAAPQLTLENLTNYTYQRHVSQEIGRLSPVYRPAIRWKSQMYYSWLGLSANPSIIVGKEKQLYAKEYIEDYCSRDLTIFMPEAEAWVRKLREAQDFFTARGTTFLYVLTPSKVAVYADFLPAWLTCPSRPYDRTHKVPLYVGLLKKYGINYVDAATLVAEARLSEPMSVFPRGGIHWNMLAASIAGKAVTDKLATMRGSPNLTPFTFTYARSYYPQGSASDLMDIMNLVWPDTHYEVPVMSYRSEPRGSCEPLRVTELGGSFLFEMNEALMQVECPPRISNWFYWDTKHFLYPGGTKNPLPVDPAERQRALLDDLDVLIFEENESVVARTRQGEQLFAMLADQAKTAKTANIE